MQDPISRNLSMAISKLKLLKNTIRERMADMLSGFLSRTKRIRRNLIRLKAKLKRNRVNIVDRLYHQIHRDKHQHKNMFLRSHMHKMNLKTKNQLNNLARNKTFQIIGFQVKNISLNKVHLQSPKDYKNYQIKVKVKLRNH